MCILFYSTVVVMLCITSAGCPARTGVRLSFAVGERFREGCSGWVYVRVLVD